MSKLLNILLLIMCCTSVVLSQQANAGREKEFKVFDGTMYANKPDLNVYGVKKANVLYEYKFWKKGEDKQDLPDKERVKELAKQALSTNELTVVDIEAWWLHGSDKEVQESVDKYVKIVKWMHQYNSALKVGMFGVYPIEDHGRASLLPLHPKYIKWKLENRRLMRIVLEEDYIIPSIYTFYNDKIKWKNAAISMIKEARAFNKPIYVFLWPYFSEKSKYKPLSPLPEDYWKMELEVVWEYADGVIIWGGWDPVIKGPAQWKNDFSWWVTLKEFMREKGILKNR